MSGSASSELCEVLIVDDDKVVALLHKNSLRSSQIEPAPVICDNGRKALEYIAAHDGTDKKFLILLDLNMPVLDGWKFLKKLNKNPPQAKVFIIIVTSSINQKDHLKAQTYGQVIHFCRKPLSAGCILKIKDLEQVRHFFLDQKEQ